MASTITVRLTCPQCDLPTDDELYVYVGWRTKARFHPKCYFDHTEQILRTAGDPLLSGTR